MTVVEPPRIFVGVAPTLADRIEEIARRKGWSLRRLGTEAGLKNPNHVSVIVSRVREKPDSDIETDTLRKLARAGGVSAAWLAGEDGTWEDPGTWGDGGAWAGRKVEATDDDFASRYPNLAIVLDLALEKGVSPAIIRNARRAALKSDTDRSTEDWWKMLRDVIALEKQMDADLAAGKDVSPKLDEDAAREEDPPSAPPPQPKKAPRRVGGHSRSR